MRSNPTKIIAIKDCIHGVGGYRWAWEESAKKKVFGFATSPDEIRTRATRMLKTKDIELCIS